MKEGNTPILFLLLAVFLFILFLPRILIEIEKFFYYYFGKIHFIHFYPRKKQLTVTDKEVLNDRLPFYKKLQQDEKQHFEHRVASFIEEYDFYSRGEIEITREIQLLIAATATKLTFGFRDFTFPILNTILVYPKTYMSKNTNRVHKGEFNPKLKTLVFSWEDFLKGHAIADDNINLGIHEFTHVIHINSYKEKDINSVIFKREYNALKRMIQRDTTIMIKIRTSTYFRKYAFDNQYEFIAVLIENFIETPEEFKAEFPHVYQKIKKMLNYNFLDY